jgi:transcriptional regulator with XRE-family HTH domain
MNDKRYTAVGPSLRKLREKKGLSQDAVAKAARIGRSTLVRLEAGADARLSNVAAVANVLGAEVEAAAEPRNIVQRRQARLEQAARIEAVQGAHFRIALNLVLGEPAAIKGLEEARKMVNLWEHERVCSPFYIDTWKRILGGSPREVGKALSRLDEQWARALLQNTPFGSLINQHP